MNNQLVADCVLESRNALGEVPLWCTETNRLWWIDVKVPSLHSFDPGSGAVENHPLPGRTVGSWAFRQSGGMILAMQDGLYAYQPETRSHELKVHIDHAKEGFRLNDGRCDRRGRFWIGSMHLLDRVQPRGSFYRVDGDFQLTVAFDQVMVSNSVAFSPDDKRMYFADTTRCIWVFDFDLDSGTLSRRRMFADTSARGCVPDGSTVDSDGCLWNAEYKAGQLVRYTPNGVIDLTVKLPVSQPTACIFGGKQLDVLYVTTGNQNLDAVQLQQQPQAGGLFAIRIPGIRGMPEPRFAG